MFIIVRGRIYFQKDHGILTINENGDNVLYITIKYLLL